MKLKIFSSLFLFLFVAAINSLAQQAAPASVGKEDIMVDLSDPAYTGKTFNDIIKPYKGKVIYLDLWASWCNPCKQEMPYSHKLQEKFNGKDVVFLYISVDKNAAAWRNAVTQLQLSGQLYLASQQIREEITNKFNLQFIPRYILFDKTGKVAVDNAKRPSDPQVIEEINKFL